MSDELWLIAYRCEDADGLELAPATTRRAWMDATQQKYANRCLPMLIANQSGWVITIKHKVEAVWNGGETGKAVTIRSRGPTRCPAHSDFGHGVLTWRIPWVFRTPPGWNLLAKGPANWPKDGIQALEGLIETDWVPMTFTMNWVFTAPNVPVSFEPGDPVCMIVPQRRGELESFHPEEQDIMESPDVLAITEWAEGRSAFKAGLLRGDSKIVEQGWQKTYFRGEGGPPEHQLKRKLRPFER